MRNKMNKKWIQLMLAIITSLSLLLAGCDTTELPQDNSVAQEQVEDSKESSADENSKGDETDIEVKENNVYSSKEEVALYIHSFEELPPNYITKNEAMDLGWESKDGNLWDVAPGMSIGGDKFGNREGLLPKSSNRKYFECDIDYEGGFRNEKRIVYSNDGLIFYTGDHYKSFEQLY